MPLARRIRDSWDSKSYMAELCHQFTFSPPISIEVVIDIRRILEDDEMPAFMDEIKPLAFLRNIGAFKVKEMYIQDIRQQEYSHTMEVVADMEDDLKGLVEGSLSVDNLYQMYEMLKVYCGLLGYDSSAFAHVWESGVLQCNVPYFKMRREGILDYLEPQYRQIMAASLAFTDFTKSQKGHRGIFGAEYLHLLSKNSQWNYRYFPDPKRTFGEAIILLEDFARSFPPTLTFQGRISKLVDQDMSDREFKQNSWKFLLKQARPLARHQQWGEVIRVLKATANDLDDRYLEMREARKKVFHFDGMNETQCGDFDVQAWMCDEKINWEVYEPRL